MVMLPSGSAVVPRMMPTLIGKRAVEEELLALDVHRTNEIFLGAFVDLAAAVARVDEGTEADAREMSGAPGGDIAEEMRDDALREIVGLNLVRDREALQLGYQSPVPPNHTLDQALMAKVIEAALLSVALTRGVDECEVPRFVFCPDVLLVLRQVERLESDGDLFGKADADKASRRDGIVLADQPHGFLCADDLSAVSRCQRRVLRLGCG